MENCILGQKTLFTISRNEPPLVTTSEAVAPAPQEVRHTSSSGGQKGVKAQRYSLVPVYPIKVIASREIPFTQDTIHDLYRDVQQTMYDFWSAPEADLEADLSDSLEEVLLASAGSLVAQFIEEKYGPESTHLGQGLFPPKALELLAVHFGKGASKYAAHNWRKGYPLSQNFDAFCRHFYAFFSGEEFDEEMDSPHIVAALWHIVVMIQNLDGIKQGRLPREFDDRFYPQEPVA